MENLAGYALEVNIGGGDALEVSVGEASMLRGEDGITPTIGDNGNWYLGDTDTGKPSRGAAGAPGKDGQKGDTGTPGKDGHSPVVTATKSGKTTTISVDGAAIATVEDGADGTPGKDGAPGAKGDPGEKGDTGPQGPQGPKGDTGSAGANGKSAYQYAVEGGYTGTEAEFAKKLASEALIVTITESNGTLSADKSFTEIMNTIYAGIPVLAVYDGSTLPLIVITDNSLYFGTFQCDSGDATNPAMVVSLIIEITPNGEVNDVSAYVEIPKTLPNPNAITFTGAVTGSYDGSAPVSVEIPSAVTDDHINSLIDAKLGVIENGSY